MKYEMTVKNSNFTLDTTTGTISGQTFAAKEWIKENFSGIYWNASSKTWTMDADMMTKRIIEMNEYFVRVAKMTAVVSKVEEIVTTHHYCDTLCPICHTYCNGDCEAAK